MSSAGDEDLCRQVKLHVESLREAGVEWVPVLPANQPGGTPCANATGRAETDATGRAGDPPVSPAGSVSRSLFEAQESAPVAEDVHGAEQRRQALELLAEQVSTCSRCAELYATRTQTVFGEGPLDAEVCFIGEAPGGEEDAQGRPFVGPAGQLLNRILAACGLKREEVYICNILRCRPPGNRTPLISEADNCREYLDKTIELVRPKFICALGGCAAQNLLKTTQSLSRLRGRFHDYRGIPVLCTYHPAYLLPHRNPEKKREVWEDMKLLMARMGRQLPQQRSGG